MLKATIQDAAAEAGVGFAAAGRAVRGSAAVLADGVIGIHLRDNIP
ncbi:hypothetical protein [Aestuariivirga sp.]|nr:hypothetical protein [Aestuariivirga sp.]MCA3554008.1 hypothetical protein [Aestuariivirga sp.]